MTNAKASSSTAPVNAAPAPMAVGGKADAVGRGRVAAGPARAASTDTAARSPEKAAAKSRARRQERAAVQAFVLIAMMVIAVAIGIGLYLQFGFAFSMALLAAFATYAGLLCMHVLIRRRHRVADMAAEIDRLELELAEAKADRSSKSPVGAGATGPAVGMRGAPHIASPPTGPTPPGGFVHAGAGFAPVAPHLRPAAPLPAQPPNLATGMAAGLAIEPADGWMPAVAIARQSESIGLPPPSLVAATGLQRPPSPPRAIGTDAAPSADVAGSAPRPEVRMTAPVAGQQAPARRMPHSATLPFSLSGVTLPETHPNSDRAAQVRNDTRATPGSATSDRVASARDVVVRVSPRAPDVACEPTPATSPVTEPQNQPSWGFRPGEHRIDPATSLKPSIIDGLEPAAARVAVEPPKGRVGDERTTGMPAPRQGPIGPPPESLFKAIQPAIPPDELHAIQGLIKRLANDLTAGRAKLNVASDCDADMPATPAGRMSDQPPPAIPMTEGPRVTGLATPLPADAISIVAPPQTAGGHTASEDQISRSVEALRHAANSMRTNGSGATSTIVPTIEEGGGKAVQSASVAPASIVISMGPPPLPPLPPLIDPLQIETPIPASPELAPRDAVADLAAGESAVVAAMAGASVNSSTQVPDLLDAIADAVETRRMDVLVEPILGLQDRKARHFELSVRLRSRDGLEIGDNEYRIVAAGSGLVPRIDAFKMQQSATMAEQLKGKGKRATAMSQVNGESLIDNMFLDDFAATMGDREGIASHLVLSFAQSDVRGFTDVHWETLDVMRELGLCFALEAVTALDMDFEALAGLGFAFVKLDADFFLEGMPAEDGIIPADDLCRYFAGIGLGLIVGHIDDEMKLARIVGFGGLLGQGTLFGAPRPVQLQMPARSAA